MSPWRWSWSWWWFTFADLRELRVQFVVEAVAAILLLVVITALSVCKPRGLMPHGWRKQRDQRQVAQV